MKWPEAWCKVVLELIKEEWGNYCDWLHAESENGEDFPSLPPHMPELADDTDMDSGHSGDDSSGDRHASNDDEGSGSSVKSYLNEEVCTSHFSLPWPSLHTTHDSTNSSFIV